MNLKVIRIVKFSGVAHASCDTNSIYGSKHGTCLGEHPAETRGSQNSTIFLVLYLKLQLLLVSPQLHFCATSIYNNLPLFG